MYYIKNKKNEMKPQRIVFLLYGWLVVGFKADCLTRDLGLDGMPSVDGLSKGS